MSHGLDMDKYEHRANRPTTDVFSQPSSVLCKWRDLHGNTKEREREKETGGWLEVGVLTLDYFSSD